MIPKLLRLAAAGCLWCTLLGAQSAWSNSGIRVLPLASPAGSGSGQPCAHYGADGRTYLSWVERLPETGHRLRVARLGKDGFEPPRTAAEGTDWFVNWADRPSVAALSDGTLAVHWLQRLGPRTYDYGVRVRISVDDGGSWGVPFWLHRDRTPCEHGFASLAPYDKERFAAIWLDGRAMPLGGAQTLRATLFDRKGKLGKERLLDDRVCECCPTALAAPQGALVAVYRDCTDRDVRDIGIVRGSPDSWERPGLVHDDGWLRPG